MPWLVDGDNLLGTWPGRRRSDGERRALAFELERFAARAGKRIDVVFDGAAPPGSHFAAGVRFAGAGRSADDVILERLREEADRGGWIVVTADRSLGDRCRWLGARVERSDRFRHRLTLAEGREKPEREEHVRDWLREFGAEEE